ncbi:MAG: endonuclease/exonuclease/phosphatase family protein [Ignavibacteria bacterium]
MRTKLLITILLSVFAGVALSQQQVKIMTYNLLNYPGTDTAVRNPYFRTVVSSADPDILIVSEITSQTGVNIFLSKILNSLSVTYSAGVFIDGTDTDNAIFFKTAKFNFISNTPIATQLRNISEFKICDKIYNDTLRIFGVHLKANPEDSLIRAAEVDSLRKRTNLLPVGTNFIVAGDFNIYRSNESAYKKLLLDNPGDDGNFNDPFTLTGTWNSFAYRSYHTQSTRTRSFGNGSTGGLDDRFDMILYSGAVKNSGGIKFIPGSYVPYGNDGNHYNDSINKLPNTAVSVSVANALHYASDHLPVYAAFEFGSATIVNVNVIPEGMYNISLNKLNRRDSVSVNLRNIFPPYSIVDSSKSVIDSITFIAPSIFRRAGNGSYFVVVKTINSVETWSKTGGMHFYTDSLMNYDFTSSPGQAFGNNLILKGVEYCIYSGDVNADGIVNLTDILVTFNDGVNFLTGYNPSDINGDNTVNLQDLILVYNNSSNFVSRVTP